LLQLWVQSKSIDSASLAEICPSNRYRLTDFGAFYIYGNGAEFVRFYTEAEKTF
jgi:hypothetical protein|tara:strand:+ start:141 stop:302 length:162 start_codon:yes stop_codon:yes gene_type:complete